MSAPDKIWHEIDRKGGIKGCPDANVEPCAGVLDAFTAYTRTAIIPAPARPSVPEAARIIFDAPKDEKTMEIICAFADANRGADAVLLVNGIIGSFLRALAAEATQ